MRSLLITFRKQSFGAPLNDDDGNQDDKDRDGDNNDTCIL